MGKRNQRDWLGNVKALRLMCEYYIETMNGFRSFVRAYNIPPEEIERDINTLYSTATRILRSDQYKVIRDEYIALHGMDKDVVRDYSKSTMAGIIANTKDAEPDTAIRATALLAKIAGIDTNEGEKNQPITINFTNGR